MINIYIYIIYFAWFQKLFLVLQIIFPRNQS